MKSCAVVLLLILNAATAEDASPIGKVIEMISEMQAKIMNEGKEAQHTYEEAAGWCEDKSKDIAFEIKTGKAKVEDLEASISEAESLGVSLTTKIEDLAASVTSNEADLKEATGLRAKEAADHDAEAHEIMGTIDELKKAINVLNQLEKHGASMLQVQNAKTLAEAFDVMVQASAFSASDAASLTAMIQSSQKDEDEDESMSLGAPAGQAVEDHTGGIMDMIQGLYDKAEARLEKAQQKEKQALYSFKALKLSLEDEIKYANRDMSKAKKDLASSKEELATAKGDLEVTSKDLAEDVKAKATLHQDCMTKARDFEAETKSRGEELEAIATAKKIIIESTGAAVEMTSFLQVSRSKITSRADLANLEVATFIRQLAKKESSRSLAQLASKVASASRSGRAREDIFAKVKGLITDMISKLEDEAAADASEKAYCDKELGESNAKHDELSSDLEDVSTKIDQAVAKSAKLKEEVADLQKELSQMAKSEAEMDKIRLEEKTLYGQQKSDMEKGLNGVKLALKVLRDYYSKADKSHGSQSDSAGGIMDLLEVCESDFSKTLAEIVSSEETAVATYDSQKKENEMEKVTKEQDVKYKTKEGAGLDKAVTEHNSDKTGISDELASVDEYLNSIKEKCVAKPESYAERKARRDAEIAGLKNAMEILDGEAVLLQKKAIKKRFMRQNVVSL